MTARDDYPSHEQTFAAADSKIELAQQLLARAEPVVEGDAGWLYLTKTRRLPADAVRAALRRAPADRTPDRGPRRGRTTAWSRCCATGTMRSRACS